LGGNHSLAAKLLSNLVPNDRGKFWREYFWETLREVLKPKSTDFRDVATVWAWIKEVIYQKIVDI